MSIGKILKDEDLSERNLKIIRIMHIIGDQAAGQIWDEAAKHLNKFTPMSGNEALSFLSTLVGHITARLICCMKEQIADHDETGYVINDIQETIFNLVSEMISTKKLKIKESPLPNGIKKLTKYGE